MQGGPAMKQFSSVLFLIACIAAPAYANESPEALQDAFMTSLKANDPKGIAECYAADAINFPVDSLVGYGPESVA